MPVSLNHSELQLDEPIQSNTTNVLQRRAKTTNEMVDDAFIQLHTAKGVTLKQIYSFVLENYNLHSISPYRKILIKKHIIALRESEDIINKTGKGFNGHLKLVDKNKFIKKIKTNMRQARELFNATRKLSRKTKNINKSESNPKVNTENKSKQTAVKSKPVKRNFKKPPINTKIAPVIPRQVTPPFLRNNNVSMFSTPMVASQVHTSTPFISAAQVPPAPEVTHRVNTKRVAEDEECVTPRSSLPGKRRRLLKRPE